MYLHAFSSNSEFFQLRGFVFALYPKPKTQRWKTSEFDLIHHRFECSAKWKTRSWKTSKVGQSTSEFDQNTSEKICEVFISEFSVLAIVQNRKGKPRKKYSPRFPRFLRTPSFRPYHPCSVLSGSSFLSFSACLIATFSSWLMTYSIAREASELCPETKHYLKSRIC